MSGRNKQQGAQGIQTQAQNDSFLVAELSNKQSCRNGHGGIAAIKSKLNKCRSGIRYLHDGTESRNHRVGYVVGKAPKGKQTGRSEEHTSELQSRPHLV